MILRTLKEATRTQHERLEATINVMSRILTLEDYKELLCKFYRFFAPLEKSLEALDLAGNGYDLEARRKVPKLLMDLEYLKIPSSSRSGKAAWNGVPEIPDLGAAYGCLYVVEGGTLGGQVISRQIQEHLGLGPANGAAFFNCYGELTGPMWAEFGAALTEFVEKNGDEVRIIDSAKRTFDSFTKSFKKPL